MTLTVFAHGRLEMVAAMLWLQHVITHNQTCDGDREGPPEFIGVSYFDTLKREKARRIPPFLLSKFGFIQVRSLYRKETAGALNLRNTGAILDGSDAKQISALIIDISAGR